MLTLAVWFAALTMVGWAMGEVAERSLAAADLRLLERVGATRGWIAVARAITWLGSSVVLLPVTAVALGALLARRRAAEAAVLLGAVAGFGVKHAVKALVDRPRPAVAHLVDVTGSSFPSGHAFQAAVTLGALAIVVAAFTRSRALRGAAWSLAVALALVVGLTRISLGVHYPSDVAGAYVLAAGWLIAVGGTLRVSVRRSSFGAVPADNRSVPGGPP